MAATLLEVAVPVALFTTIVLALTALVLLAHKRLEPSGTVALAVGSGRTLEVEAGQRLLWALAKHDIYLPAACGGRGTCGQCRVTVTNGAQPLLPTETPHIAQDEADRGVRLACLLKLRGPLTVEIETDVLEARRVMAVIESSRSISAYLKEVVLRPEAPIDFEAGDYVLIETPPHRVDFELLEIDPKYRRKWEDNGFFELKSTVREPATRAYSIASPPQTPDRLALVIRIALPPPTAPRGTPPGRVSSYLFSRKPGDTLNLRGPFGDFHIKSTDREIVFIGGGAGIAPLRSMILDQLARQTRRKMSFWYGAREIDDLCYFDELSAAAASNENFDFQVALSGADSTTDWHGHRGLIHAVVRAQFLARHASPHEIEYYLCGPPLMSAAVLDMLAQLGVPRENIFFDDFGS